MYGLEKILNSDALFVYFLSFVILIVLLYDLLERLKLFGSRYVSMIIALIISFYVFLTNGYRIINLILSISTVGIVILFGILLIVMIVLRFWKRAEYEAGYF